MPDTSPTPVDLDAIEDRWLRSCPSCDAGMSMTCRCPTGDPRNVISNLVDEIRALRSRASIGPDSERIRELEAEVQRLRENWSDLAARCDRAQTELTRPLAQPDVSRLDKAQGVALVRDYMRSYK